MKSLKERAFEIYGTIENERDDVSGKEFISPSHTDQRFPVRREDIIDDSQTRQEIVEAEIKRIHEQNTRELETGISVFVKHLLDKGVPVEKIVIIEENRDARMWLKSYRVVVADETSLPGTGA